MREVAIVGFAAELVPDAGDRSEIELLRPLVDEALEQAGLDRRGIDFTVSGSSDYLAGAPFAFVTGLDAMGAWPPISESHVEMDGAFALYEAWVRMQEEGVDTAVVYAFGKSSTTDVSRVLSLQLDPYVVAPLWPGAHALAGLQARALLDAGVAERDIATVAARAIAASQGGHADVDELLARPYVADPLRAHDLPVPMDGAAVMVLAAGDRARELSGRPVWVRGMDHRIEAASLGARDLAVSPSARAAAQGAGVFDAPVDLAELSAPYAHQELILREALSLDDRVPSNPEGGSLRGHALMADGLLRVGAAARRIRDGEGRRAVAHATAGPCLQQNLMCVLEGAA